MSTLRVVTRPDLTGLVSGRDVSSGFNAVKSVSYRRALPWLGLALVLVFYVISILRPHSTNFFGLTQDDTIYFSSAKPLTAGKSYILQSLPGTPPATKYPILYTWILSWVWRWNPVFPANLAGALAITLVFGIVYVILVFLFLRKLRDIGDAEALLLTAFCALHPTVLFYSSSVLSDILFSAMALGAMLVAKRAMQREARPAEALGCGILAALSMLMRVLGVAIAAGVIIAGLARRAWMQAAMVARAQFRFLHGRPGMQSPPGMRPCPRALTWRGPDFGKRGSTT